MAGFFKSIFGKSAREKREYPNIKMNQDPDLFWEIVGELGDGAFGKVYKAKHRERGSLAAAKIVELGDGDELDDFVVEIDILAACGHHPHILSLEEAYLFKGKLWMLLEFCPGGAMDDIMLELDRGLTEKQIKVAARHLFEALIELRSKRIIHRDLKAGNLLLCADGSIKLGDFGVSAINKKTKQRRDSFIGTPFWMAPEVVVCETNKDLPYDYRADIWSAGITLIELADMQPPYHEMHPMRVLFKIPKAEPPRLVAPSRWSPEFNDFLAKCLVKDPNNRPTAEDMMAHPFLQGVTDWTATRRLYAEMRAAVVETVEELGESEDAVNANNEHDLEPEPEDVAGTSAPSSSSGKSSLAATLGAELDDQLAVASVTSSATAASTAAPKHTRSFGVGNVVKRAPDNVDAPPTIKTPKEDGGKENADPAYKTLRRTRTFLVDGKEYTSTTEAVIDVNKGKGTDQQAQKMAQQQRKIEYREMKILQREEQKEAQNLFSMIQKDKDDQEHRFEQQRQDLEKRFDTQLDATARSQRKEVEKFEKRQRDEYANNLKKMKVAQGDALKKFRKTQKQDEKRLEKDVAVELDKLKKSERKVELKKWKDEHTRTLEKRDNDFCEQQNQEHDHQCQIWKDNNRQAMRDLEAQFLTHRQDLIRRRETEFWDMEQRHMHEHYQLSKHQLKEAFLLQRHQMVERHKKELEQHARRDELTREIITRRHAVENKQLPQELKKQKNQSLAALRKTCRKQSASRHEEKEMIKKFEEQESKRHRAELATLQQKHEEELNEFSTRNAAAMNELKLLQEEKCALLVEREQTKLQEHEEHHQLQVREYKEKLHVRKTEMEAEFSQQTKELLNFYNTPQAEENGEASAPPSASSAAELTGNGSAGFDGDSGVVAGSAASYE
eukprot:scpid22636/ scgid12036/ Serine/threonine-protein kinase 10